MARVHDPLHWARKAAQHPLIEAYQQPPNTPAKFLIAVSKAGHGLYRMQGQLDINQRWWCRFPDGSWLEWTGYEARGRGFIPKKPPLPGHMNPVQPTHGGPRWHYLTDDDSYHAQRLRIDPTYKPGAV